MIIVFRVDASQQIGTGHLMRCLTLAAAFRSRGFQTVFISRTGNVSDQVKSNGHVFRLLEGSTSSENIDPEVPHAQWLEASWEEDAQQTVGLLKGLKDITLIVDHYAIDNKWESVLRKVCQQMVVMDDLADRRHHCDLLIDTNYKRRPSDYSGLVSESCTLLTGTDYVLLRSEFAAMRDQAKSKRATLQEISRILVFMSGTDPENFTEKVLKSLALVNWTGRPSIDVVLGKSFEHIQLIKSLVRDFPLEIKVIIDTRKMAQLIYNADLAIGSAGGATWERCCLGLPAISLTIAENQVYANDILGKDGIVIKLEKTDSQFDDLVSELEAITRDMDRMNRLSQNSFAIIDGKGTERVAQAILDLKH